MMAVVSPELTMTVVDPEEYVSGVTVVTPEVTVTVDSSGGCTSVSLWCGPKVKVEDEAGDAREGVPEILVGEDRGLEAGDFDPGVVTGHTVV